MSKGGTLLPILDVASAHVPAKLKLFENDAIRFCSSTENFLHSSG
jgi:hypothetical protein